MTQQEVKAKSEEKINQIFNLMKVLQVEALVKTHITKDGFVEDTIYWIDKEKYDIEPDAPVGVPELKADPEQAPKEKTNETSNEKITK